MCRRDKSIHFLLCIHALIVKNIPYEIIYFRFSGQKWNFCIVSYVVSSSQESFYESSQSVDLSPMWRISSLQRHLIRSMIYHLHSQVKSMIDMVYCSIRSFMKRELQSAMMLYHHIWSEQWSVQKTRIFGSMMDLIYRLS